MLEKVRISGVGELIVSKQLNTVLKRSGLSANLNLFPKNLERWLMNSLVVVYKCYCVLGLDVHDGVVENLS